MNDLPIHPAAAIFELDPIDELAEDIRKNGLREPIWITGQGFILDGRRRQLACERSGVTPRYREWDGVGCSPEDFVWSENFHRRHLDASQKAMAAAKHKKMKEANGVQICTQGRQTEAVGKKIGVSARSVSHAEKVIDECEPEVAEAVTNGRVAVSAAAALAGKSREEQLAAIQEENAKVRKKDARTKRKETFAFVFKKGEQFAKAIKRLCKYAEEENIQEVLEAHNAAVLLVKKLR